MQLIVTSIIQRNIFMKNILNNQIVELGLVSVCTLGFDGMKREGFSNVQW